MANCWHVYFAPSELDLKSLSAGGEVVWGDDLHVGPVPSGLDLHELSELRKSFWAALSREVHGVNKHASEIVDIIRPAGIGRLDPIRWVERIEDRDEVVLWFRDDLPSQLAALQCIDCVPDELRLSWVPADSHRLTLTERFELRSVLSTEERSNARELWATFQEASPLQFYADLRKALHRFAPLQRLAPELLAMFPSRRNGLDHVQSKLLELLDSRPQSAASAVASMADCAPLSDLYTRATLYRLLRVTHPLIEQTGRMESIAGSAVGPELALTRTGERVLAGKADAIELNGVDTWVGGCHIESATRSGFRWDSERKTFRALIAPPAQ